MNIKIWYRDTIHLMQGGGYHIIPDSPLKEATIISSENWGWHKVVREDSQLDSINSKQIFYIKHGRKERVESTGEKYPYLPLWNSKKMILWNSVGWHIIFLSALNGLVYYACSPNWMLFVGVQVLLGWFFNGLLVMSFLAYLEDYKKICWYKDANPNYKYKHLEKS